MSPERRAEDLLKVYLTERRGGTIISRVKVNLPAPMFQINGFWFVTDSSSVKDTTGGPASHETIAE